MSSSKRVIRAVVMAGAFGAAAFGSAGLAGCVYDAHPKETAKAQELLPTEQFAIQVTNRPEQIALGLHAAGLSANQQAALAQFVDQWREDGGGAVTLRAPTDSADPHAARRMEDQTAAYLTKLGIPPERVRIMGYTAGAPGAPVLASYERFEAKGPNCSGGWKDIVATGHNTPYDHFGCALTANIAVQVANPRDFLAPAVVTPSDDPRREVVLSKYRKGDTTSTAKDEQASGRSSENQ